VSTTVSTARIHAGLLTQRITLQSRAAGQDVLGQPSGAWSNVAEVWARARPLRSRELFAAGRIENITDVEFTIRWRSDVRSTWRIQWRGAAYDITGEPIDVDGQQQWLEVLTASTVRDAR
jgi:SPP1 family predicted phage head-tail adaptor